MDTKASSLWGRTLLLVGISTLAVLLILLQTPSDLVMLLPWGWGPVMGLLLARIWNRRRKLSPAAPPYVPSPLLAEGAFDLSGAQFFPLPQGYSEPAPRRPTAPPLTAPLCMAWAALILAVMGCVIPFFLVGASLVAFLLAIFNPAGFQGHGALRPMPIQRLTLLVFCLGFAGLWASAMIFLVALL